ncbi:MAG: hypothetical protein MRK02_10005 [Candidatus Scalindua sp.]|nr:hypothetical protein [Candidatus Scalindua sp.]
MPQTENNRTHIAYFISPHGFGHAARAASVMEAVHEIMPSIQFEIFTKVPEWFFEQSLTGLFTCHDVLTDIGLVQITPLSEDLPGTLQCLNEFLPFDNKQITRLAKLVNRTKCELIICDIAPMGIEVAKTAGIPSLLIENFTWDWIYRGYVHPDFPVDHHIHYLKKVFDSADYHIQTEPVCLRCTSDLTTVPVSRKARSSSRQTRQRLGIPDKTKTVLITMGGIPEKYTFFKQLAHHQDTFFIIPGNSQSKQLLGNLVLLPHHSDFYHPDLMNSCDAVIGKIGYSTLAEAYHAGVPFGYVPRPAFCESRRLEMFVRNHMEGCSITDKQFHEGCWIDILPDLLAFPVENGTLLTDRLR